MREKTTLITKTAVDCQKKGELLEQNAEAPQEFLEAPQQNLEAPFYNALLPLSKVAGFAPCFNLEFGGEIVGRLKVEAVGYFLDAHVGSGEQLFGSLQA